MENWLCRKLVITKNLSDCDKLEKLIASKARGVSDLLHMCDLFKTDVSRFKKALNSYTIEHGVRELERRWNRLCTKSTDRKRRILTIQSKMNLTNRIKKERKKWLENAKIELTNLDNDQNLSSEVLNKAFSIYEAIDYHEKQMIILESTVCQLFMYGFDRHNIKSLNHEICEMIDSGLSLSLRLKTFLKAIQDKRYASVLREIRALYNDPEILDLD